MNSLHFRIVPPLALLVLLLGFSPAQAQQNAAADTAAVITSVAREFEARGDTRVAEALLRHVVERYPGTVAAGDARRRLDLLAGGDAGDDDSGHVELYVWSTLYGLWTGVAIPGALGADGPEAYGAGLLLSGPAAFLTTQALLRNRSVGVGQARAITWGGTWGTWQGYGWGDALGLTTETVQYSYEVCLDYNPQTGECLQFEQVEYQTEEMDEQKVFASMLVGGAVGIAAGALIARRGPIAPGTATLVNFGSLWGSWYAFALGVAANQDEHDDRLLMMTLLGGNAGLLGTALLAPQYDISQTRARLINIAGVVGLLGGLGIDLIVQPESDTAMVLIPMVTSAFGLVAGAGMTRDSDTNALEGADRGAVGGMALLQLRDGRWDVGVPAPIPTVDGGAAGLRLPLLHARF